MCAHSEVKNGKRVRLYPFTSSLNIINLPPSSYCLFDFHLQQQQLRERKKMREGKKKKYKRETTMTVRRGCGEGGSECFVQHTELLNKLS